MYTCTPVHVHKHLLVDWLRTAPIYPITLPFDCCEAQPNSISNGRPASRTACHDVCFMINIEARQLLHCHTASSSCGPRVKQHGESWDVITQSVCAILIKTLLTVLHYWNTPHRTLLNSLNKLAPAPLIIHRMMSTFFFSPAEANYDKKHGTEGCKIILNRAASHEESRRSVWRKKKMNLVIVGYHLFSADYDATIFQL